MGELHDASATLYGDAIMTKIRHADQKFQQIFSTSVVRTGDWDWPRPDYVCYDEEQNVTYALEFKPPFQSKREYLTGLGQTLAYLQKHMYSGLIVPYTADDGFHIADFISDTLRSPEFSTVAVSLYAYDYNTAKIDILHPITALREAGSLKMKLPEVKTFWCWWRDLSHYELYELLNLSFAFGDYQGDIYTDYIYPAFYKMMVDGKTRQWDGMPRSKNSSDASMKSEKQNCKIPLVQPELWSREECRLTDLGYELLEIGKKFGPDSKRFMDRLTYLILVNGRHLDLINIVEKFQKAQEVAATSGMYTVALETYLSQNGCIGKRKPTAVKTGAKNSYMRDEMKLWNKLGLLYPYSGRSYFFPGKGYQFNWKRITDVLVSGSRSS